MPEIDDIWKSKSNPKLRILITDIVGNVVVYQEIWVRPYPQMSVTIDKLLENFERMS